MFTDYNVEEWIWNEWKKPLRFIIPKEFKAATRAGGLLVFSMAYGQEKEYKFFLENAPKNGLKILYASPLARNTGYSVKSGRNILVIFEKENGTNQSE